MNLMFWGLLNLALFVFNSMFWPDPFNVGISVLNLVAGIFCLWGWVVTK